MNIMIVPKTSKLLLWVILSGVMWTKAALLLSMPFLTLYLYKSTDLSIITIGLIVGAQPFALCFGSVIGGYLADIFKRQTLILFSILISSFVFMGFFLVSQYLLADFKIIALVLLNLLNGFCAALFSPVSRVIISDAAVTPEENIKFLHLRYFALNIGGTVGPLLGAYAGLSGSNQAFLITSILYFIYAIVLYFALKNYKQAIIKYAVSRFNFKEFIQTLSELMRNKLFISLLLSLILFNVIYVQLSSNLGLIINKNIADGTLFFSWMLSLNALLVVILQPIIFKLIKSRRQSHVIFCGFVIISLCSLLLVFLAVNKVTLVFFVLCLTIAEILIFPTGSILVTEVTPEMYLGIAFGVIDLEYFGSAIGPAVGGLILQFFNTSAFYIGVLIISILCCIMFLPLLRQRN